MAELMRISPQEVLERAVGKAVLVCAYEDYQKFQEARLLGAIWLLELESYLSFISRRHEIIFYCGDPDDASAAQRAAEFAQRGYANVRVLAGGVEAWKAAGLPMAE